MRAKSARPFQVCGGSAEIGGTISEVAILVAIVVLLCVGAVMYLGGATAETLKLSGGTTVTSGRDNRATGNDETPEIPNKPKNRTDTR